MQISPHFSLAEATATMTGLPNHPPELLLENIIITAWRMEHVRAIVRKPIHVLSWYRSPSVNDHVGGSDDSDHLLGVAVDFFVKEVSSEKVAERLAENPYPFDQIITYRDRTHIHIGWGTRMRRQRLRM